MVRGGVTMYMYHWRAGIPVDLDMASHSRPCSAFPGVSCDCVGVGGAGWPLLSPGHAETLARGRSHWPEGHTSCTVTATNPVYVVLVSGSPSTWLIRLGRGLVG